ncbi:hypothetical protein [Anabaena sp. CCY 0017]|uniref:hypothetical protein n=1 Tax=Anabaena sp. CCY 0017 TaxID=3103866 RepID=UPI0039C710A4
MSTVNVLTKLSMATAGAAVIALGFAGTAQAAIFNFSFSNENGAVNGDVKGTIELADGDGTFAATSVMITSLPGGLGLTAPVNALSSGSLENVFSVVGGQINLAGTGFFGLINGNTALSLNASFAGGSTFLDALNGNNFDFINYRTGNYSGYQLSEIQEPHPQPPPRKRGGGYDVLHSSAYRYNLAFISVK